MDSWGPNVSSCGQQRFWLDWADAQADLSLRWAQMSFCWFCNEAAHLLVHELEVSLQGFCIYGTFTDFEINDRVVVNIVHTHFIRNCEASLQEKNNDCVFKWVRSLLRFEILQTHTRSQSKGPELWLFVWIFLQVFMLCGRTTKVLVRLCGCLGAVHKCDKHSFHTGWPRLGCMKVFLIVSVRHCFKLVEFLLHFRFLWLFDKSRTHK